MQSWSVLNILNNQLMEETFPYIIYNYYIERMWIASARIEMFFNFNELQ